MSSNKKPHKLAHILSEAGSTEAQNELTYLFREICYAINMTPATWHYRMGRYIEAIESPRDETGAIMEPDEEQRKRMEYSRGNLGSQLLEERMTWRTFKKGIAFLAPIKCRVTMDCEWPGGVFTRNQVNIRPDVDENYVHDMRVRAREKYVVDTSALSPEEERTMRDLMRKVGLLDEDGALVIREADESGEF